MSKEQIVRAFAGAVVLTGLALGHWVNGYWYLLSAFAGLNLFQSAFTKFCLLDKILKKAGIGGCPVCGGGK